MEEQQLGDNGQYPLKWYYKEHHTVSGTLLQKYDQRVLMAEIKDYLTALECLPCISEITVTVQEHSAAIKGWVKIFTPEAEEVAHHAIYTLLLFAGRNLASSADGTATYEITYQQRLKDLGED
jgi:hypothetical protein